MGRRLDPLERSDLLRIETPAIDHETESVQKAACLQLMNDRCSRTALTYIAGYPSMWLPWLEFCWT